MEIPATMAPAMIVGALVTGMYMHVADLILVGLHVADLIL
jgi:hypothetical protein